MTTTPPAPRILVGTPTYNRQLHEEYTLSLLRTAGHLAERGIGYGVLACPLGSGPP